MPFVFRPGTALCLLNPGMAMLAYAVTTAIRAGPRDIRTLLRGQMTALVGDEEWGRRADVQVDGLPLVANWRGSYGAPAAAVGC